MNSGWDNFVKGLNKVNGINQDLIVLCSFFFNIFQIYSHLLFSFVMLWKKLLFVSQDSLFISA